MSSVQVRPFERRDREQLTRLVNRHIEAVVPGAAVSVNSVLSQLEREPREAIVDPWVSDRRTLVAVEREAIVAAGHLLRYGQDARVGEPYRGAGEVRWLICDPSRPEAGHELMAHAMQVMDEWGVSRRYADGSLPAIATYGVPACWPHIRELYVTCGFHPSRSETILVAWVSDLPHAATTSISGAVLERWVGDCGTRFSAVLDDDLVGFIEIDTDTPDSVARFVHRTWSDIGNLHVREDKRRQGVASWLLGAAADWLRLGGVERLLAYVEAREDDEHAFLVHHGFRELTRTERGWRRGT
jgi:GNAT superfamily N-acetyltransferase